MQSPIRIILVVLALGAVAGIVFMLTRPTAATATVLATPTPLVITQTTPVPTTTPGSAATKAGNRERANNVKATGNLISANQASLAFLASGRVKEIKVKEGDLVKTGAILASLDTSLNELQIAQAQAALDLAKANFDRIKTGPTVDDVAIAKSNFDRAKAALDQAQAAFDRAGGETNPFIAMLPQSLALQQAYSGYQAAIAQYNLTVKHPTDTELKIGQAQVAQAQAAFDLTKQNLTNSIITAPFDGTILTITPKLGELASPGAPAIVIADLSKMQAQVNLDEITLSTIRVGQPVTLTLDALGGKAFSGRVKKIGLLGTSTTGIVSVPVTIDLDATDAPIYPGLSATVEFQVQP